jgi:dihydroorotase
MHEGEVSTRLGLEGIPASSESVSIAGQIILAEEVDYPVHFTHVSARSSLEMIRFAKERGIKVTADVTPHHLVLNHEACCGYDTAAKVNPPLRSEDDRRNLIEALRSGVIDCIATDHAPHTLLDKWVDFKSAAFGISGIETFVALCVTKLIHEEKFSWSDLVAKVTCNPAKIMRLDRGNLAKGSVADIVLIDENLEKEVSTKHFLSKGKNSPFDGYKLRAWPVLTMVSGKIRMRDFEIFAD